MRPYRAKCPECGHIWYFYSRKDAYNGMLRHCKEAHPQRIVEPYLTQISEFRYWLWKFNPDKGKLEQIARHAGKTAVEHIRNIPQATA